MSEILEIKKYPDSILREKCAPVGEITSIEVEFFNNMLLTMQTFCGIGLAAPQIGISKNLIVVEVDKRIIKLANPKIISAEGKDKMVEGCLSLPEISVEIERPFEVEVSGLNEKGKLIELKTRGLMARVIQHEIDHLNGKLIIDYANLLQKFLLFKHKIKRKMPAKKL